MFTIQHLVWSAIVLVLVVVSVVLLKKYRLSLKTVLTIACVVCVLSELVKVFSSVEMVPSADGTRTYPYLKMQHLPLHLCSLQILFIFYARFAKAGSKKDILLAFMYPSCLIGALFAVAIPTIFMGDVPSVVLSEAFTKPLAYQYFLYHAMLITLGIYIPMSGEVQIKTKHYFTSLAFLAVLAFLSLYYNSMFAAPVYEAGKLISVEYVPNLLFTYEPPIDIALTEPWHWYLYLAVLTGLAFVLIAIFYIPFFVRDHRAKKQKAPPKEIENAINGEQQ